MPKTTLHISIPEPCHEDWSKMTATQCGAFCNACQKEVIDFSTKSEAEIVDILSKANGKVCGRIPVDKLNRELIKYEPDHAWYSWKKWAVAAWVLLGVSNAKGNSVQTDTIAKPQIDTAAKSAPHIMGLFVDKVEPLKSTDSLTVTDTVYIRGKITDENNEPVISALVMLDTNTYAYTDFDGYYILPIPTSLHGKAVLVRIHYLGYEGASFTVVADKSKNQDVQLTEKWEAVTMGIIVQDTPRTKIRRFFRRIGNAFRKR